jgi:hypothetical protein
MYRFFAWSVVVLFPVCLLAGCGREEGTPAANVKTTQPQKEKKTGGEAGAGKNAATVTD